MSKLLNATIKIGEIELDVDYFFEPKQNGDGIHTPTIPPSVEIYNVSYEKSSIYKLLVEIDSDDFYLKIENKLLEGHD